MIIHRPVTIADVNSTLARDIQIAGKSDATHVYELLYNASSNEFIVRRAPTGGGAYQNLRTFPRGNKHDAVDLYNSVGN